MTVNGRAEAAGVCELAGRAGISTGATAAGAWVGAADAVGGTIAAGRAAAG